MPGQTAKPQEIVGGGRRPADSQEFIARNLSDAYRLAAVALDDPVAAVAVVHDAIAVVRLAAGSAASDRELDRLLRQRLEADLEAAIRSSGSDADPTVLDPLEAAIAGLRPSLQVDLVRAFGPWTATSTDAKVWQAGAGQAGRPAGGAGPADGAAAALTALRARLDAPDSPTAPTGDLDTALRALYAGRDPGEPPPLQLRLRLQQDQREAEAAAARMGPVRPSGWGFVVNTFMALVVLILVLALASVVNVRGSAVVNADPTSDPTSPLTIASVTAIQVAIDTGDVHVGSTQRTLLAAFAPSSLWHPSARECLPDILGTIDWQGNATWGAQSAGHVDLIAGDPSSNSAYVAGEGSYCEPGQRVSLDGGATWTAGSLPGDPGSSPTWIGFDPSQAHTLVLGYPDVIYESPDSGSTWKTYSTTVVPIAFDSTGRLVGWTPGNLLESLDDGATWRVTNPGPTQLPVTAGATADGVLIGATDGLWWYPIASAPTELHSGSVYSIATLAQGAVVLGADADGHPWVGAVDAAQPGISLATLPPGVASMKITGGGVAVNDAGAALAFSGPASAVAFATFAR